MNKVIAFQKMLMMEGESIWKKKEITYLLIVCCGIGIVWKQFLPTWILLTMFLMMDTYIHQNNKIRMLPVSRTFYVWNTYLFGFLMFALFLIGVIVVGMMVMMIIDLFTTGALGISEWRITSFAQAMEVFGSWMFALFLYISGATVLMLVRNRNLRWGIITLLLVGVMIVLSMIQLPVVQGIGILTGILSLIIEPWLCVRKAWIFDRT